MKIKAVCAQTELTDRTVRYYIEEGLISPAYTENYLGRKTFTFSEADVDLLWSIAVLRKFGFSIPEIKEMLSNPTCIVQTVEALRRRKQAVIDEEQALLAVLARLDGEHAYTVPELAAVLSAPVAKRPLPAEDLARHILRSILRFFGSALTLLIVWLPVAVVVFMVLMRFSNYTYPKVNKLFILLTLITLLPTVFALLLSKIKKKGKLILKIISLILCFLSIPISFLFSLDIIWGSETTNIRNYRKLDAGCLANRDTLFQELFPTWPHYFVNEKQPNGDWEAVYLDAHYYYRYIAFFDYTYDIYAEWPLEQDAFDLEVARVRALFEEESAGWQHYSTMQKGNYKCLILYGASLGDKPFEEVTDSYTYYIFAYDSENLRVRYLCCGSLQNGAEQPYYLSLDW